MSSGSQTGRRFSLAPGEILFRQGDDFSFAYLVESGRIETYRERPGGSDEPRGRHGPGEVFGLPAALDPGTRSESARAVATSVLLASDPQSLRSLRSAPPTPDKRKSE